MKRLNISTSPSTSPQYQSVHGRRYGAGNYSTTPITKILKGFSLKLLVLLVSLIITQPSVASAYTTNMRASLVIGQADFASANTTATASVMDSPVPTTDGTRLIACDMNDRRALIWNQIPTSNGQPADVVVGQQNFTSTSNNQGGSAAANTLSSARDCLIVGQKLLIVDSGNNRILIYNNIPTQNNASANVVFGQPDMTTTSSGTSNVKMNVPYDLFYDQPTGKLFVADSSNRRVLIYNRLPETNGASADVVVGQPDFTTSSSGTTASKTTNLYGVAVIDNKLFIADGGNNRVLIWNSIPTQNGASADVVIGQSDFTSSSADQGLSDPTAYTLHTPTSAMSDGRRLFISENGNNRVLIYNQLPTQNNASANIVLGQPNFASDTANQGGSRNDNTFSSNIHLFPFKNRLYVGDSSNRRILVFDNITDTPKAIFTSSPVKQPDGKMRFAGDMSLSGSRHSIWKIEASVNGGPFGEVTSLIDTVRTNPGIPDDIIAKFYHDVTPWDNDNSTEDKWTEDTGFTVRFKVYSTNVDLADPFFYFTPFTLDSVKPIKFSVNKKQIDLLKDNLDHYEVWVKKDIWEKHIDQIPVSYDLARDKTDNLLSILDNTLPEGGNGIYENGNLKATYTNDSSTIEVSSKLTSLTPGTYQIKAVAVDKYGHSQETLPQELVISEPFPYRVNPKKPRVQGVSVVASPSPTPVINNFDFATDNRVPTGTQPLPAPRPSPSPVLNARRSPLDAVANFFNALIN